MEDVKIFRLDETEPDRLVGASGFEAGWMKRIIYPKNVVTRGSFFGVAEVNPGFSPHTWHNHQSYKEEGFELIYPKDFEEVNYIISGSGIIQWNSKGGKIKEEKVSSGDAIFFPAGVAKHQIFNNGSAKMLMVFCGCPTAKFIRTK